MQSESVNGANAGRKSLPEEQAPDVSGTELSLVIADLTKDKAPEPSMVQELSMVLLDKHVPTMEDLQQEVARY